MCFWLRSEARSVLLSGSAFQVKAQCVFMLTD